MASSEMIKVGPTVGGGDGSTSMQRGTREGAGVIQQARGKYAEAVRRGRCFHGSNQAAQAVSVALATTYTGLCLSNPNRSNKDLLVRVVGFALSVAPAAIASLHLIGGWSATDVAHTAAVTPDNAYLGATDAPQGKLDSQATIPTPKYLMSLNHGFTAAALPSQSFQPFDLNDAFILGPGGFIALGALTAVTGFASFFWEEVPTNSY